MAASTGLRVRGIFRRRAYLANHGVSLKTMDSTSKGFNGYSQIDWKVASECYAMKQSLSVKNGSIVVFSDAHYWPGITSLAHDALVTLCKALQPAAIVANGDVFDGATVSRHDPLGWQELPTVVQELTEVKARLLELRQAAPKAKLLKTVGNHDSRFDRKLASGDAAAFKDAPGFRLSDHLKDWPMSYVVEVNVDTDPLLIMHNFKGGPYAQFHNAVHSGAHIVTGHLHAQQRIARTDYFKTAYSIDAGCLADPDGPQFSYAMGRPKNWRSGAAVLSFDKCGRLLPPELLEVQALKGLKRAVFRGEVIMESYADTTQLLETHRSGSAPANRLHERSGPKRAALQSRNRRFRGKAGAARSPAKRKGAQAGAR